MPGRFTAEVRVVDGNNNSVAIAQEQKYHMGPGEGRWWLRFSWWVIPLGLIIIVLPWLILAGAFDRKPATPLMGGQTWVPVQNPASVAAPSPQVVPTPTPTPTPQVAVPADPTADMSPEDRRLYERLVLRK